MRGAMKLGGFVRIGKLISSKESRVMYFISDDAFSVECGEALSAKRKKVVI
jgi:hypothetical protein